MARVLLIADSNFKNNIGAHKGRKIKDLEIVSCQSRKSAVQELTSIEEGIVVIACLDMITSDIVKSTVGSAEGAVEVYLNQLIFKLVDKVDETDGRVAFGVVAPLFWTSHPVEIKRALNHTFKLLKKSPLNNIWFSNYVKDINAGNDGVHLTNLSADRYVKFIHEFFEYVSNESGLKHVEFINPEATMEGGNWADDVMDLSRSSDAGTALLPPDDEDQPSPARTTTMLSTSILHPTLSRQPSDAMQMLSTSFLQPTLTQQPSNTMQMSSTSTLQSTVSQQHSNARQINSTQERLLRLADQMPDLSMPPPTIVSNISEVNISFARINRRLSSLETRSYYTNVMTATLKEEQDTEANRALLNRVTFSGVVIDNLGCMDEKDKVTAMRSKIAAIIDLLKEPEQTYEVQFVRHLNWKIRGQTSAVIEVKFPDAKQAKDIRNEFVKKQKSMPEKINITPVVRLATRVRIEILHSVAEAMRNHDQSIVKAYCLQFVPKPVIRIVRKSLTGAEFNSTMTFIEAVTWVKENEQLVRIDLKKARDRAGASFRGTLAQHFVVLD